MIATEKTDITGFGEKATLEIESPPNCRECFVKANGLCKPTDKHYKERCPLIKMARQKIIEIRVKYQKLEGEMRNEATTN